MMMMMLHQSLPLPAINQYLLLLVLRGSAFDNNHKVRPSNLITSPAPGLPILKPDPGKNHSLAGAAGLLVAPVTVFRSANQMRKGQSQKNRHKTNSIDLLKEKGRAWIRRRPGGASRVSIVQKDCI